MTFVKKIHQKNEPTIHVDKNAKRIDEWKKYKGKCF